MAEIMPRPTVQSLPTPQILSRALVQNPDFGFIYLNNPKVGCSTIKASLWAAITGLAPVKGENVHLIEGSPFQNTLPDPDATQRAFIFTFVRNPFQRLVSAYLNKVVARRDLVWDGLVKRFGLNLTDQVSFDGFVEMIASIRPEQHDAHWRPQHLNTLSPFVRPNLIGDLEALDQLLPQVLGRVFGSDVPGMAQRKGHRTQAKAIWRDFYRDSATVARVRRIYEADFAIFGYEDQIDKDHDPADLTRMSDHDHPGLAALSAYRKAAPAEKLARMAALEAADGAGVLAEWCLAQRLHHPKLHGTTRAALLAAHGAAIAGGSAFLRTALTNTEPQH